MESNSIKNHTEVTSDIKINNHHSATSLEPDLHSGGDEYKARFAGKSGEWLLSVQSKIVEKLLTPYLKIKNKPTILDIGGGHGQITPLLLNLGFDVTLYSTSYEAALQLHPLLANQSCKFICGPLSKLGVTNGSFDFVSCFRIIPHYAEWSSLIAELCRVSKIGVIVDYPSTHSINALLTPEILPKTLGNLLFKAKRKIESNTRPYLLFNPKKINQNFSSNDFNLDKQVPQLFWPMALHRKLSNPHISGILENTSRCLQLNKLLGSPIISLYKRIS